MKQKIKKYGGLIISLVLLFNLGYFLYDSYQMGKYEREHGIQEFVIFDHMEFKSTGLKTQYIIHKLPKRDWKHVDILYEAYSPDDYIDRIYSVSASNSLNGSVEIHRGITPLQRNRDMMNCIRSMEDISQYIPVLKGTVVFWSMINVYHYNNKDHSWFVTVTLRCYPDYRTPSIPPTHVTPVFMMEKFTGKAHTAHVQIPQTYFIDSIYIMNIHATGHNPNGEEYKWRAMVVYLDGNEIARFDIGTTKFGIMRGGWFPGQGTVQPLQIPLMGRPYGWHEITIDIPESGDYWLVSLCLLGW